MSGYKSAKVTASGVMSNFSHLIDPENSQPLFSLAYLIFQCMQIRIINVSPRRQEKKSVTICVDPHETARIMLNCLF